MHFFSRRNASLALSLAAVGVLAACGDDVTVPVAPPAPVVVSITPQAVTLNPGSTATLSVQISGGDPTPTLASCASGAAGVATAAVSGSGCTVTAVAAGSTTITATTSGGQQASAAVTVNSLQAALGELTVSPAVANLVSGQNLTLVPNANAASNAVNVNYTYATASAAIATVNGSGVVTAVAPGTTTITVTATGTGAGFSSATRTFGVTVNVSAAAPAITSLNVQPTSLSLATGSTGALTSNATQPAGATAATYTYASANTAIATVTGTGANATVTAVAAGNTTITVTATAPAGGGFGASTVTQLIPVSVAAPASLTIQTVTQGPIKTSYVDDSTGAGRRAGIVTEANAQVNQPIDITAVRDQIQVAINLVTNGQRVDSVVAFIADADGSNRRAAARQLYSNGQANEGLVTLFVNTADFTADFETGAADVLYGNGQKVISASVFTTNGDAPLEIQNASNNRQVVNFANFDGYAIQYVNPTRVADGPAGLNWRGGPGEEGTGRFSVVPVWYSGKTVKSLTMGMRQGLMATIDICGAVNGTVPFSRETVTAAPFALTYDARNGRNVADANNPTTTGNGNLECGGYEHPAVTAQNIAAVVAGVDTDNNPAPAVTFADGYRFSSNVARPVNNRLDYAGPSTTTPNITRNLPAVTGWVNQSFNFNTNTAASTDAGVGVKAASRTWAYNGCTTTATGTVAMADATGASVPECATNFLGGWDNVAETTRGPYRVRYVELDNLDNPSTSAYSSNFGSDWTAPLIRWSAASAADTTIRTALSGAVQFQAEFIDERGGFMDANDVGAPWRASATSTGFITTSNGSQEHFASRAGGMLIASSATTKAVCVNPNALTTYLANAGVTSNAANIAAATGAAFQTAPACSFRTQSLNTLGVSPALDGYRSGNGVTLASQEGIYHYATRVYDRAGNVSEVLRRRLAVDATAGLIANLGVPAIVTATATPVLTYNAQDNVEIRATVIANTLPGIALPLVYPQGLVDARFNDNINSPIAQATTQLGVPAPTLLGVSGNLAVAPAAPIQTAYLAGFDVANRITPTITAGYLSQGVPTLSAVPNAANFSSWGVLTSRAASFNAPEGLKAQLVSNTNVTNSPFGRVEFYRLSNAGIPNGTGVLAGAHWQYLGSSSTAIPADQGNTRYWTYTLPDNQYASLPTAFETQQSPAVIGDDIIAIGVLASNGSGFVTNSIIGGSAINFTPGSITFTAPPAGFPTLPANPQANITVAGGTQGFNAVVTGVGILALDSDGGVYTVTANPVTINGVLYQPTNALQVVNVPAGTIVPIPNNIVYQPQVLGVNITTNLPAGGTISVSLNGPVNVTATIASNGAIIPVPQAGNYTVVANTATLNIGGQTYNTPVVGGSPANVVAGVPPVATINYSSPAFSTGLLVNAYNNVNNGDFTVLTFLDNLSIASNALVSPTAVPAASIGGAGTQITAASNTLQSNLQNGTFSITNLATLFTTASIPAGQLGNTQVGAQVTTFGGTYAGSSIYNNANGTGNLIMRPAQIRITTSGVTSPALTNPTNWQLDATVTGPNLFTTGAFFTGGNAFVVNGAAGAGSKIMTVPVASPGVGSYQLSIPNTFVIGGTTFTAECSAAATGGNTAQVVGNNCLVSINAVYSSVQNININYTGTP